MHFLKIEHPSNNILRIVHAIVARSQEARGHETDAECLEVLYQLGALELGCKCVTASQTCCTGLVEQLATVLDYAMEHQVDSLFEPLLAIYSRLLQPEQHHIYRDQYHAPILAQSRLMILFELIGHSDNSVAELAARTLHAAQSVTDKWQPVLAAESVARVLVALVRLYCYGIR